MLVPKSEVVFQSGP